MINKKNLLGKVPDTLGDKDAIHVAIVSVRAARPIKPGERCGLTKDREATPDEKGCGVADPFRNDVIGTGQSLWMLLAQNEVPNVQHHWEHPKLDFSPPTVALRQNSTIASVAKKFGVTYEQVMEACAYVVKNEDEPAPYPGSLAKDVVEDANDSDEVRYDLWSEWAEESGHEFENCGTACCPEYDYPECGLFSVRGMKE